MKIIIITTIVLNSIITFACDIEGKSGFLSKTLIEPSTAIKSSSMTKAKFNKIIDRIEDVYSPIISSLGKELVIKREWKGNEINAYAAQKDDKYIVLINGALARSRFVSQDALALIVCHEIGHHLAGSPQKPREHRERHKPVWASNEGQSDYFASSKCFRKVFKNDDNVSIIKNMPVRFTAEQKCKWQFKPHKNEIALCIRTAMAGKSAATLSEWASDQRASLLFKYPSKVKVRWTNHNHPEPQCRLDTYFQGALCQVSEDIDFSTEDPKIGACNKEDGHQYGMRPRCWYQPVPLNEWGFPAQ